eukprot:Skav236594  [mRNA]  locus=scaffold415:110052:110501:+ [translate_table: standard]
MSRSRVLRFLRLCLLALPFIAFAPSNFSVARKGTAAPLEAAPILGFGKYREKTILEVVNEARVAAPLWIRQATILSWRQLGNSLTQRGKKQRKSMWVDAHQSAAFLHFRGFQR